MIDDISLNRFLAIQERDYPKALNEINAGKKQSHWMWYIFPQLRGLGRSKMSEYYGIQDISEAKRYLENPILRDRLIELCKVLLLLNGRPAAAIFGSPDDSKLHASMTLFLRTSDEISVFGEVIEKYFNGMQHRQTIELLKGEIF